MGRPRGFDEVEVIGSAADLFARRSYDGVSIDELVARLGVHRNSLYKTFGSKRGLYLAALRWSLRHEVGPLVDEVRAAPDRHAKLAAATGRDGLDLLLLAALERAPEDSEVAAEVALAFTGLDEALAPDGSELTAVILGLRLRAISGAVVSISVHPDDDSVQP